MTASRNCLRLMCAFAVLVGAALPGVAARADDSRRAAARLGYDTYEVANLIAAPAALFEPAGQQFVDLTFAELDARSDATLRARFGAIREALRPMPMPFDPAETSRRFLAADRDFVAALPAPEFGAYSLGSFIATVAFNARVLREDATDATFRRGIGSQDALDASVPGVAAARAKLAADAPDAWDAIVADADALGELALGEPLPAPHPASRKVWAVLVRGRPIESAGPRLGSLHTSLDVVYGDGSHATLGAYPNGKYDFSQTGGTLSCARDLEPSSGPSRAYTLVPPKNVTYDDLAERFSKACTAFDKHRPRFPYVPQDDVRSNDNAFIAGLLRAESLDLPQGL